MLPRSRAHCSHLHLQNLYSRLGATNHRAVHVGPKRYTTQSPKKRGPCWADEAVHFSVGALQCLVSSRGCLYQRSLASRTGRDPFSAAAAGIVPREAQHGTGRFPVLLAKGGEESASVRLSGRSWGPSGHAIFFGGGHTP